MSVPSKIPFAGGISSIRENYDTSNPVIAEILKAKEERLKILQELNKEHQEDFHDEELLLKKDLKTIKKSTAARNRTRNKSDASALRRSIRLQNCKAPFVRRYREEMWELEPPEILEPVKPTIIRPPNDYGEIPGVEIGDHWETRLECSQYGVHRPTVAGIHGGPDGAYSIALSGGYPEDIDEGHSFVYTGAGGRDLRGTALNPKNLRTAPQTKDQRLEGTNLSLVRSIETKLPVRVIRGYKSPSIYAPETGYRYDGLYQVVEYWEDLGKTGHKIYRFRMERMKDQPPAPWEANAVPAPRSKREQENGFSDGDEFKENIPPDCVPAGDCKEEKDFDNEIQTCIEFFCKSAAIKCSEELEKDCSEEEFHGWD